MNVPIKHQIIEQNGKPAFAVVPYDAFLELLESVADKTDESNVWIPHEVVKANVVHNVPMLKAWREYLGLTQRQVADKAGMSQPAYAKLEKLDARPRMATMRKIAKAMGLSVEQIVD